MILLEKAFSLVQAPAEGAAGTWVCHARQDVQDF